MARRGAVIGASSFSAHPKQGSTSMPQIGQFARTQSGYSGRVRTLLLDIEVVLMPVERGNAENAPDFRIHLAGDDGPEVGAAWKRTGERAGDYLAVVLDAPVLPQPIHAHLFQAGDDRSAWGLHWRRPSGRSERA
jgi:uncharacterized protein (DUF736 family)